MTVLVAGLGASGRAMAVALQDAGRTVRVADERGDIDTSDLPTDIRLGPMVPALLQGIDLVATSPGIAPTHPLLAAASKRGIPVWSEPEVAWQLNSGRTRLVGVTGTNGKTTTTQMIADCLDAPAAGNIGPPLVTALTVDPPPVIVVELSSFQLHFCHDLRCDVAVLVNVADDHLDWHGGPQGYRADKARIWGRQRPTDVAVVNAADQGAMATAAAFPPRGQRIDADSSDAFLEPAKMTALGPHNLANATLAAAAAMAMGAQAEQVRRTLSSFSTGAHRLQFIRRVRGVDYVNDSKATNPHAALAALTSYDDIVWIAGGLNKGLGFEILAPALSDRVRQVLTIGACGPEIAALARRVGVAVEEVGTLEIAVDRAQALTPAGSTVLLAPAAASMDQFTNYAERGQTFNELVARLQESPS